MATESFNIWNDNAKLNIQTKERNKMNDDKLKELLKTLPQDSQDKLEEIIAQSLLDEAMKTGESPKTIGEKLLKDRGEK